MINYNSNNDDDDDDDDNNNNNNDNNIKNKKNKVTIKWQNQNNNTNETIAATTTAIEIIKYGNRVLKSLFKNSPSINIISRAKYKLLHVKTIFNVKSHWSFGFKSLNPESFSFSRILRVYLINSCDRYVI